MSGRRLGLTRCEPVRTVASGVLGRLVTEDECLQILLDYPLKDKDKAVRQNAAYALGEIGQAAKDAVPALLKALKDEDTEVKKYAMGALGEIGPDAKAAVPALIETLKDDDLRYHAASALGGIGPEGRAGTDQGAEGCRAEANGCGRAGGNRPGGKGGRARPDRRPERLRQGGARKGCYGAGVHRFGSQ